jgi:hypothetical protein
MSTKTLVKWGLATALTSVFMLALLPISAFGQNKLAVGQSKNEKEREIAHARQKRQRTNTPQRPWGTIRWSGRVDDVVDIYFQERRSWTKRISGKEVFGEPEFVDSLPLRDVNLTLDMNRGRGRGVIRQQPNRDNDYICIIRIADKRSGSDNYKFTLNWEKRRR